MKYYLNLIRGDFLLRLLQITIPITLQTVVFSSKSIIDTLMLGSLGEYDIAAIGIAGKALFVVIIFLIGLSSGGAQIAAQYWGSEQANKEQKLQQTIFLTWLATTGFALLAAGAFYFLPEVIVGSGTNSAEVIARGSAFLKITSINFLFFAYTCSIAVGLRAMHQPSITTFYSLLGVVLNIGLNWVLIFGRFGFPKMGIAGAAYGTLISAGVETLLLYAHLKWHSHPLSHFPKQVMQAIRRSDVSLLLKLSIPSAINSTLWALGVFVFYAVLGSVSVESLAALSILSPIESFSMALLIGLSSAASILLGGSIGANRMDEAYERAWGLVLFSLMIGIITCVTVWLLKAQILALFSSLTPAVMRMTGQFFDVMVIAFIVKSVAMMMVVGVLRPGGEAKFCLYLDFFAQWLLLLPLAAGLRYVLNIDPLYIYGLLLIEESIKVVIAFRRIKSRKWLNNFVCLA
ncbi:MATE family efflux transporter [Andreprevotia chitinilytica]|uniref:MATE family efflux transporter n=1 Tax=Andreprevotia chitinilytica TaxID=396808 RepID=UPI00068E5718|nr:MATE family efflux transporter [Andreprevotia chitinilytica]